MAVREYIGARYVTKVYENSLDPSSAEWEASVNYEPLVLVTYNNGSYLSKKPVPASVGDPASNPSYWVQTGFYNGQILYLQSQIDEINDNFVCPEHFGAVGDGVTDDSAAVNYAIAYAKTNNKCVFFPSSQYGVSTSITVDVGQNMDFSGTKLICLADVPAIHINAAPDAYSGAYIRNLVIDHNFVSTMGMYIEHCWRWNFIDIRFLHIPDNSTSLKVDFSTGSLFENIRGISQKERSGNVLIDMEGADSTFNNIDWQMYQIGIKTKNFNTYSNVHGYISQETQYPGSIFMYIDGRVMATNLYPDCQQHMIEFTRRLPNTITNVYATMADSAYIDVGVDGNPILFYSTDTSAGYRSMIDNVVIQSGSQNPISLLSSGLDLKVTNVTTSASNALTLPTYRCVEYPATSYGTFNHTWLTYTGQCSEFIAQFTITSSSLTDNRTLEIFDASNNFTLVNGIYSCEVIGPSPTYDIIGRVLLKVDDHKTVKAICHTGITANGNIILVKMPFYLTYPI